MTDALIDRETRRKSDPKRIAYVNERNRRLGQTPEFKLKRSAQLAVRSAIAKGLLRRQPCEKCGDPKADGHHDNYAKPLEVRWLCRSHHAEAHGLGVAPELLAEVKGLLAQGVAIKQVTRLSGRSREFVRSVHRGRYGPLPGTHPNPEGSEI